MTIVAAIIAILAGFGQFGTLILPPTSNLKFMRADIAIRCLTEKPTSPQATDLVALLSGDQGYVNDLIEFLVRTPRAAADDVPYDLHWIHPKVKMHPDGKAYDLDWKHAANAVDEPLYNLVTGLKPSDDTILSDEISDERKWVAYSVNIQARNRKTSIPIPATYETDHILHLFAALAEKERAMIGARTKQHWQQPRRGV